MRQKFCLTVYLPSFALMSTKLRIIMCVLFGTHLKKLFSQIDSLSALADTMKNFLTEQSRKALIFAAKSFYRSNLWGQILLGVFLP